MQPQVLALRSIALVRQRHCTHFVFASAGGLTDDDAATKPANPAAPSEATRSPESGLPPASSESTLHLADHFSAYAARMRESVLDDRLGIQFPVLP